MSVKSYKYSSYLIKKILYICCAILLQFNILAGSKITNIEPFNVPDEVPFFDEEGKEHFLDEFENNVVLLVFWASWCSACSNELPELDVLQKDFRKLPFKIIAVSEDFHGIDAVKAFYKVRKIRNLKIYHDPKNTLFRELEVVGTPTSFLINMEGKVVASFVGATDWYNSGVREIIMSHMPPHLVQPKNSEKPNDLNIKIKDNNKDDNKKESAKNEAK